MLKCVMLDFGNTLMDFYNRDRTARVYTKVFRKYGYSVDFNSVKKTRDKEGIKHHTKNYGKPCRHKYHILIKNVLEKLGYSVSVKKAKIIAEEANRELSKYNRLFPGTRSVLSGLKKRGLKTVLVCNGTTGWMKENVERFRLKGYIDYMVVSEELGKEKSKLTPFRVALRTIKMKPEDCLMVGDKLDEDMYAKKLGMLTCHADYGPKIPLFGKAIEPDFRITDICQLLVLVTGSWNSI